MVIRALVLVGVLSLAVHATAFAHSLFGGDDPNRPLGDYVGLGFLHMVTGWDHLLFIAGVVLLSGSFRTAAKLISLFVLGHSITLLCATLLAWRLDATLVDVVIALSLVYVGVEIGQLSALALMVGAGLLVRRFWEPDEDWRRAAWIGLVATGVVAAGVIAAAPGEPETERLAGGCTSEGSEPPPFEPGATHPAKSFGPEKDPPEADLTHVIGDGYVIVRYRRDLSSSEVDELRRFAGDGTQGVAVAPKTDLEEALRAQVAERTLRCDRVSMADLTRFRDDWLAGLRQ